MKCPCHSNKDYSACCEKYHKGLEDAPTPLLLMRSRYAAYALNLADYIIRTTHQTSPHYLADFARWTEEIKDFSRDHDFTNLSILSEEEGFPKAYVTFKAHLKHLGKDASFIEKSTFIFEYGRWFFL